QAEGLVERGGAIWPLNHDVRLNQTVTVVDATRANADLNNDGMLTEADIEAARSQPFDITGDLIYSQRDINRVVRLVMLQSRMRATD
ncbi:MAG: hypothetical protein AAFY46_03605, partial [Planctomycetota bacterium]